MLGRALGLAAGLTGAAAFSQFPEFSQQYVQRLGGAVDELARFVDGFDEDAAALGLDRQDALADLRSGGEMATARADRMETTIARYERLRSDLAALRDAGPFTRAYHAARLTDAEIAEAAWRDYRPAMPLTFEGAVFGGTGFVLGLGVVGTLWALLRALVGRRPRRAAKGV
ncbi:DUF2937 family protein [Roseovarius sp. SCSIO 43702]|uniref:DUF2937 family protein n=1 Tax=Roseovarius sp. SCSIO 43702 TaxID=2823043 RepID=UPI001C7314BA|nr:DUF2937 family protein [Roseovarius sp. SCSIO 43702]QYX55877.1 DUF2937 family protein [Roseovarius sp. SCSIO 43702]